MIVEEGSKYRVTSEDGSKNLGTYDTREEAERRLRQVEYFKVRDRKLGDVVKARDLPSFTDSLKEQLK